MKKHIVILTLIIMASAFAGADQNPKKLAILVYPFEQSGAKNLSWIAAGLTDTVISDLNRIQDIYVFSEDDRKKAIKEIQLGMTGLIKESDIIKAGNIMGADLIFTGKVQATGSKVRVNARLINISTTKIENSVKLDGTVDDLFDLQDRVVFALMTETEKVHLADTKPVKIKEEEKNKVKGKTRPKQDVYQLYSKGLEIHETDPRKALEFYLQALEADPHFLDGLLRTGSLYGELNEFDNAMNYLSKAAGILEANGQQETVFYADMLNNRGVVYRDMGDHEKALEFYNKSRELRRKLNLAKTVNYAETTSNMGIVYVDTGKYDKALEYYIEAQKILEDAKFQQSSKYAILLNNIGGVYWSKKDYNSALKFYFLSQKIRDKLGLQSTAGYAYLMNNIGSIYWKQGENTKAVMYYIKSQEIRDWLGLQNTESYASLMQNIAITYFKRLNDPCKGAEYMKKCTEVSKKNNFPRYKSDQAQYEEMKKACGR
jgi:tetratricopeptide (TPR) repeat protein/TolB-like protein